MFIETLFLFFTIPVLLFLPEAAVSKERSICAVGERYNMAFKIVRTESRLVRGILTNHGFHEVHPNSNDFNLMWTGSHLKPYVLRSLQDFQKVNHFPRSYELTRKDRLYKNIQRMQQTHGFKHFHIIPQTFVLPSEYQEFRCFAKDKGPWIIKPVASSRGRGIYLVSNPNQISMDDNILVSRYINNPLLIDDFKFDMRLYVLVTSYDPLLIYVYEEGLARFATVKYDQTSTNIKNTFMHLTNYSLNKKSSDYVSCDDPEVEDYGNKWSMSAVLRYLKQEGKDTTLLMSQIEDLIIKAVLSAEQQISTACKTFVPHKTNCFELYGFDVLIDSNLKPWLLEVNLSPSLSCDAPLDLKIKASMIADMFSLIKVLRRIKEEHERRGGFIRIFPTVETWELYRNVNENVQLQVDTVHDCHVVQYERKLLSLEARKKRQRHLTYSSAGRKKTWGEAFSILPLFCYRLSVDVILIGICFAFVLLMPLFSLPHSLVSSKVQARIAFSAYLQRVQQRLLTESRASSIPVWPDRDNDQMELVIRFLKRAARNLQQDIKVVSPDPQLPLRDCKRLLSHQLGEFILCYNKETEHMVRKQGNSEEKGCVNYSIFEEYITTASESSLEEVLTFYTQKNKAASVFLGTKDKSVKKDTHGINFPGDSSNCENFGCKLQFYLYVSHLAFKHFFLIVSSLAKSQLCQSEAFPAPPEYPSPTVIPQPPRVAWAYPSTDSTAAKVATPALRRIHSFTMSASRFGAAASIPGATHIYNQKLSRPTSAAVTGSISNNLKSNSVTTFRELHSLSAQTQANQQSFISALQKLAEKQVARRCASSSHINLLTQHVRLLCLYRGVAARLAPSPPSPIFPDGLAFGLENFFFRSFFCDGTRPHRLQFYGFLLTVHYSIYLRSVCCVFSGWLIRGMVAA
uniref:Tubulin--tyrosine ligase-like protein 5 n=1 Tax=Oryzias sinensis TaxID=183150 RepID=A0A8C8DS72_9TELE